MNTTGLPGKIQNFFTRDLWSLEPDSLSAARRKSLKFLRVCALVFKGFREDRCPLHSSALTFISVMALVPFLVILFAIAKGFGFEQASQLLIERTAEMPPAFQEAVSKILLTVESASAGTLGTIGTVLFLWVAIKMLSSIEETFNLVWGVKTPRSPADKIRNYIVIMVAVPVLLIVAYAGIPFILGFADRLLWMGPFLTFSLRAIPVLTLTAAFSIIYVFLPNTKVHFSAAVIGAFSGALLAVLFQLAIIRLGVGVSRYNEIYGGLAAIPIFLFWAQMNWMILLMGAEVAFSVQNAGTYARERLAVNPSPSARLCLAFALMKNITDAFRKNTGPFDTVAYGIERKIPIRLINDVIHILSQGGFVTESSERPGSYTLLRDPENISARSIAEAVLNEGAGPEELGMAEEFPMFGRITAPCFQGLEKENLKNF